MIDKFTSFKLDVIEHLDKIEAKCKQWGVPMSKITLIMRDPNNDEMFVMLSTETDDGLKHAVSLALKQQEDKTDGQ